MVAFPEVQRRAQAELDAVVGRARPPTFADATHLPYVRAIVKEVLRWRPPVELGLPHTAAEDDRYEGMFIPKGATCMANIWQCNHDRAIFGDDADDFKPERHLDAKGEELLPGPERNESGGTRDVRIRAANLRWQTPGERLALHVHGEDLMGSDR
jgi:cytochrome P450